jgi:sirohydrochlorin ferrochelatase
MTDDTLLLIGREAADSSVYRTHARRLRERGVAESVRVFTYEHDPVCDLRETLADVETASITVAPLCPAHTRETTDRIPAALATFDGTVRYCEPVGRSPALTAAIRERARSPRTREPTTLLLVALGNTSGSHHRDVTEYHADRLRDDDDFAAVTTAYLLQNPTVECARYAVSTPAAVAVPVFLAPCGATTDDIPEKLELDRGGIAYTSPLGTNPAVTDAIQDRVETRRARSPDTGQSFAATVTEAARPLATDGEGPALD